MPPAFLVNMDGGPHPTRSTSSKKTFLLLPFNNCYSYYRLQFRFQYLVPGREKYKSKYQVPRLGITPSGDREVLDTSVAETSAFDNPLDDDEHRAIAEALGIEAEAEDRDILDHMIERMQREQDERIVAAGGEPSLLSPRSRRDSNPLASGASTGRRSARSWRYDDSGDEAMRKSVWTIRACVQPLHEQLTK